MSFRLCINKEIQTQQHRHLRAAKSAALRQFTLQDMQEKQIEIIELSTNFWQDGILRLWEVTPTGFIPRNPKET